MKKIIAALMAILAMLVAACGGSNAEAISTDNGGKIMQSEKQANNGKALVVYYSRSGNTEAVARMIGNETGADLFRVTTVKPYPEEYRAATEQARAERDSNARPAINGRVEALAAYDVIYIGVPNWWSTMPMPMFTFLEQHDLSGKTVVPFVTHGGGGVANCVSDLKKAVPNADVLEAFVVSGSNAANVQSDVRAWLQRLGLTK
ncbi:flavodoxin [Phascolarctobacterium sp.]